MEKKNGFSAIPAPMDLSVWREFQKGLSLLLDMPLQLYDSAGNLLVPSIKEPCVCEKVCSNERGRSLCSEMILASIAKVIEKKKAYIFKCHVNQYFFAVPVILASGHAFVIIGGRAYFEGSVIKDFYEGISGLGLSESEASGLRAELKTVQPKSMFMAPTILHSMSVPLLTSLVANRQAGAGDSDVSLRGFKALEQVYRSIAPVLDREELYETILAKSSELVGADRGSLMILDNKQNVLSVKASKGMDRKIAEGLRVKVGDGISGAIAARGVPVIVRDIENEVPSWKNRPRYKTKSFISLPLKLESKVIGVINLSDKNSGEVFSEEDLHLLLSFSNYASIALERGAYYSMSEELKMLSMTDPLTGLFNRRYFRERLYEEVERVKRHNECFTSFVIDIDNFKSFNDRYGHLAGDEVLKGVSRAIRDAVRSMDVVARYGGEEFAVILPHTNKADASIIAERIRKGVQDFRPPNPDFEHWPTISLGVAEFPGDASHIDDLINKADKAMYLAKRMGKNKVVVYER
ncbi:MAG: hypothetical protein A2V21_308350 [Deltaproteobacteria bacterium GWC2_55_46]|nr:MAG: hypothetical protein A2Z79_02450 [Deltaproteobacteria bacterium GWA2_55_82]OGQ62676.1 MAG: hypothetical protein A3I81_09270 [Deltaproteobacteria bacterium RIFCSPLOWO2_02_FULL_55_12]OIJ74268.1 MAG: hypothetical protein A2V21_308350 [Deltaproteobacteria bacterium GWC2_55_46]